MGFRARQIAAITFTATMVAVATGLINGAILVRMQVLEARDRAELLARSLYHLARHVVQQNADGDPRAELAADPGLRRFAEAVVGYWPVALYVAIKDESDVAILHSDPAQEGHPMARFETFAEFSKRSTPSQLWALSRGDRILVAEQPLSDGSKPLGSVVVAFSTLLLTRQVVHAVVTNALVAGGVVLIAFLASFLVANRLLAPVERLRMELARIDPGEGQPPLDLRTAADVGRLVEFFANVSERLGGERHEGGDPAWLKTMLDGLADAVIVFNRDQRVLALNDEACRLLGRSRGELEARPVDQVLARGHPLRSLLDEALERGAAFHSRTVSLSIDGEEIPYLLSAHVLREAERTSGTMVTARDLRKLSRLGSQLSYSRKLAALGRLTSGVAHEIRNPLNALVVQVALLRQKLEQEQEGGVRRHLDILEAEVKRLDRVVQGFLKFTRPEEIQLESVRLDQVVREVVDLMAARAEQGGIRLESHVGPDTPPVQGSAELLRQALLNLTSNAFDAMPRGGILRIRATVVEGSVVLAVEDTGDGIEAEALPKVFNLFYTTKNEGSGVGLSMVYRIVQLHGGEIRVESERGAGTRVTMTLPAAVA